MEMDTNLETLLGMHQEAWGWDEIISYMIQTPDDLRNNENVLARVRWRIECHSTPLHILEKMIQLYPKELGFSCFWRLPGSKIPIEY
mmetsp:Transcript_9715/g.12311  ORF Transcript_9715/g.12311 Transcript_9715/m.12311 type:complete len:87 (-) Transcript_9715:1488-1748(-)